MSDDALREYTDETGNKRAFVCEWPYTCHSPTPSSPHSLESPCGLINDYTGGWCELADNHQGQHEYTGTWQHSTY